MVKFAKKSKFVDPHFKMLWHEDIPMIDLSSNGKSLSNLRLIAGSYGDNRAVSPAPDSWAADVNNNLDIYLVELDKNDTVRIPSKSGTQKRAIYLYKGDELLIDDQVLEGSYQAYLTSEASVFKTTSSKVSFLLMQSEPINEPVTQYGPFVMTTEEEVKQAYRDYQETRFGGWPYENSDPVHGSKAVRFASYADGRREERQVKDW